MIEIGAITEVESYLNGMDLVLFDLDDTLYSEADYVKSGFLQIAAAFGEIPRINGELWEAFQKGLPAIDTVLANHHSATDENRTRALRIYRNHEPDIRLYPGVLEMLQRIGQTAKTGIVTDGRPQGQRAKLRVLQPPVHRVIITDELGGVSFRKPNETAFRLMQEWADVPYSHAVYIGDNPNKDFIAPERLGMKTIYFRNPDGLYYKK